MQAGEVALETLGVERAVVEAESLGEQSPHLDGGRRLGVAQHDTEHLPLVGELLARGRHAEHVADLEQADPSVAVAGVVGQGTEQAGAQRGPQHGLLGRQGIADGDVRAVDPGRHQVLGRQERKGQGLADAEAGEDGTQLSTVPLSFGERAGVHPGGAAAGWPSTSGGGRPPR